MASSDRMVIPSMPPPLPPAVGPAPPAMFLCHAVQHPRNVVTALAIGVIVRCAAAGKGLHAGGIVQQLWYARPFSGRSRIVAVSSVLPKVALVVFTMGTASVTVTVWFCSPGCSERSIRTSWPTATVIPARSATLKPWNSARTVYAPGSKLDADILRRYRWSKPGRCRDPHR